MKHFVHLVLLFTILASCKKTKIGENNKDNKIDFSTFELKVERGAFHYDTFILKDTVLTFYPERNIDSIENIEHQDYYKKSTQSISKLERDAFIHQILDADIWNLKEKYTPDGTCTTNLVVTINLDGDTKKIICDDYHRGCPESIQFIEKEIVRLHGKQLKRIFLPG